MKNEYLAIVLIVLLAGLLMFQDRTPPKNRPLHEILGVEVKAPTKENLDKAKKLYWDYSCNHYGLWHDGVLEEFVSLGGENYTEQWRKEYVDHWIARLETDDLTALWKLSNADVYEALDVIVAMEDYGDDYSKFWFAFHMTDLAKGSSGHVRSEEALRIAKRLYLEILNHPQGITEAHRNELDPGTLRALDASTAEEYVHNYSERMLMKLYNKE